MRIRATVAAVSGALALSAFAVPAVQADEKPDAGVNLPSGADVFAAGSGASAAKARAARAAEVPVIKKVVVNGGKDIVVGTKSKQKFTIAITASSPSGIADGFAHLWHGHIDEVDGYLGPTQESGNCKVSADPTTSTCTVSVTVDPRSDDLYTSSLAGTWKVAAGALADTGSQSDFIWNETQGKTRVQRFSKLTVQEEGGQELHDGEDRQDQLHRHPEDHRQGLGRRLLALQLRRYVDYPGRLGRR